MYKIPLFIRQQVAAPRIVAFPLEQSARIGESVEYTVIIEGDPNDRGRHAVSIANLPKGIAWEIRKVLPAKLALERSEGIPDSAPRSVVIRNVQFSDAFNRHELALLLTISRDLSKTRVGNPIPFTLKVGATRESLSITPLGVGEITLDVPAAVQVRLGEEKEILINLQNSGTETVSGITVRSVGTTYGVTLRATEKMTLTPDQQRELPITLAVASDASVGPHDLQLAISSSSASQSATLHLEIRSQATGMARLAGLRTPALICLAVVMVGYSGMKFQKFRQQRAQDSAQDYDL